MAEDIQNEFDDEANQDNDHHLSAIKLSMLDESKESLSIARSKQ